MENPTVLIVDDDRETARAIKTLLQHEQIESVCAYDGMEALETLNLYGSIRLIILDIMMPRLDGMSATLKIRERRNLPIIMLSAKSEDSDKILGLSMGADDYVTKPFNPPELVARVKSQLRRYLHLGDANSAVSSKTVSSGELCLDTEAKRFTVGGEEVRLTATEYKIVELLLTNAGRIFSAEEIYSKVWNETAFGVENTVMVHIRRIREKIEINPKEPKYLKVVWGIGYKIEKY